MTNPFKKPKELSWPAHIRLRLISGFNNAICRELKSKEPNMLRIHTCADAIDYLTFYSDQRLNNDPDKCCQQIRLAHPDYNYKIHKVENEK
jgi:hypothetical protein